MKKTLDQLSNDLKPISPRHYMFQNNPKPRFRVTDPSLLFLIGNAHNPNKECGGSSGGEGSLIGSGGSILGLGSDVGGSLRNPAFFNGIYSLKPTHGRHLSTLGVCINSDDSGSQNPRFG